MSVLLIKSRGRYGGASLVEVLTVVAILVIVSAIFAFASNYLIIRAKWAKSKEDMNYLSTALEHFQAIRGRYPDTRRGLNSLGALPVYQHSIPKDPFAKQGKNDYVYVANPKINTITPYIIVGVGPNGQSDIQNYLGNRKKPTRFAAQRFISRLLSGSAATEAVQNNAYITSGVFLLSKRELLNLTYDPTNGTNSFGDIILAPNR